MISPAFKLFKFITIFSVFVFMAMAYEVFINDKNTTIELELFKSGRQDKLCSGWKHGVQKCFGRRLGYSFSAPNPFTIFHIIETNDILFNREILISGKSESIYIDYVNNWTIIIDHMNSFKVRTDNIHFFQILTLPLIRIFLRYRLDNAKKNISNFLKKRNINEASFNKKYIRLLKTKIKLY